jgi:hypothetical protein
MYWCLLPSVMSLPYRYGGTCGGRILGNNERGWCTLSKVVVEYPVFCPECGEIHKSRVSDTVTVEKGLGNAEPTVPQV